MDGQADRVALALNVELNREHPGASARVEFHQRGRGRVALATLRGRLDATAVRALTAMLDELAARDVSQLLLDCARVGHIDYRRVPELLEALQRFESRAGNVILCGLSPYLRDLFRLAGREPELRCWPSAQDLLGLSRDLESSGERAS
jgi:anti-anti-sigma factor